MCYVRKIQFRANDKLGKCFFYLVVDVCLTLSFAIFSDVSGHDRAVDFL